MSRQINTILLEWYHENKRDLPWRNTRNPYPIWLSEIILQQTRVQQGTGYYHRFLAAFPTLNDLAKAEEQKVLNCWQGLGYYSRARNLHKTAQFIVHELNGQFPNQYKDLLKLPGVGPYTAAAIASFAYNLPHATIDGNVYRVLSRLYNLDTPIDSTQGRKEFAILGEEFLNKKDPANHNQAMMELGATICTPSQPKCSICPLQFHCESFKEKNQSKRPVKSKIAAVTDRYLHYFLVLHEQKIVVQKRTQKGIWQHLYELPKIETSAIETLQSIPCKLTTRLLKKEVHLLSHQKLNMSYYDIPAAQSYVLEPQQEYLSLQQLDEYPFPKPIHQFLKEFLPSEE